MVAKSDNGHNFSIDDIGKKNVLFSDIMNFSRGDNMTESLNDKVKYAQCMRCMKIFEMSENFVCFFVAEDLKQM